MKDRKQTCLYVDRDLFSRMKKKSVDEGISMSEIYNAALKEYLDRNESSDDNMTVTDTLSVSLKPAVEEKSWIKRKLNL